MPVECKREIIHSMTSATRSGRTFRMTEEQQAGTPAAGEATGVAVMMSKTVNAVKRILPREREKQDNEMCDEMQLLQRMV